MLKAACVAVHQPRPQPSRIGQGCLLMLLCLLSRISWAQQPVPAPEIPAFRLFSKDQTVFTQRDLPGGKNIFIFFFDPSCEHCQRAIGNIQSSYDAFAGVPMYLVSMASWRDMEHFMDVYARSLKDKRNIHLLQDRDSQFLYRFYPVRYPAMYVYGPARQLLAYEDHAETVYRIALTLHQTDKASLHHP